MLKPHLSHKQKVIIIGAGPAGLACAYEFYRQNKLKYYNIEIFESDSQVGGISKTIKFKGYFFDVGGHRFFSKIPEVNRMFQKILKHNLLIRKRSSSIYYNRKFYKYPLSFFNVIQNLGIADSINITFSWIKRQFSKFRIEDTFEKWVINRFGDKLFYMFFKTYTEKVWGISTKKISSNWAAQRIENFNLMKALINAVLKLNLNSKTIIEKFNYPKYGPGMFYEKIAKILTRHGVKINLRHSVVGINRKDNFIRGVVIKNNDTNNIQSINSDYVISTMPFNKAVGLLKPKSNLKNLIKKIQFRSFISVNLIIKSNPFNDQWIYIHDPNVKVGRIQNYRNWSPFMAANQSGSPVGMEYFTNVNDNLWIMNNSDLIKLATNEITKIGLINNNDVIDGFVHRVEYAYPIYNQGYQKIVNYGKGFLGDINNFYTCGRGGLFRYNNQDHSILTGLYVARNIICGNRNFDVWLVNEKEEYIETK